MLQTAAGRMIFARQRDEEKRAAVTLRASCRREAWARAWARRRPKQYLRLGRVPILVATLRALARARGIAGIVVAVPEAHVTETRRLLARLRVPRMLDVVAGGAERQESVWRALQRVPDRAERVLVHDAVRPFIDAALIARVLAAAASGGAATCGIAVRETVKRVGDRW